MPHGAFIILFSIVGENSPVLFVWPHGILLQISGRHLDIPPGACTSYRDYAHMLLWKEAFWYWLKVQCPIPSTFSSQKLTKYIYLMYCIQLHVTCKTQFLVDCGQHWTLCVDPSDKKTCINPFFNMDGNGKLWHHRFQYCSILSTTYETRTVERVSVAMCVGSCIKHLTVNVPHVHCNIFDFVWPARSEEIPTCRIFNDGNYKL